MKMTKTAIALAVMLITASLLYPADRSALLYEGNSAYQNKDYAAAIDAYHKALDQGHTVAVHYNLGNAYLQNGQPGKAVLHYERALLLQPGHPDVRANLNEARSQHNIPDNDTHALTEWAYHLSINGWAWLAIVSIWGILLLLLLPQCLGSRPTTLHKAAALLCLASFGTCLTGLAGYHLDRNRAIITANEAPLKVSPTENSPAGLYLQGGESITPLREHNEHFLVEARNNRQGWLPKTQFTTIWP